MADIITSGTGDGEILRAKKVDAQSWSGIRSASNGTYVDDTGTNMQILNARTVGFKGKPDNRWLSRLFIPFNTGAVLPSGALIDACVFNIYASSSSTSGVSTLYITEGTQPDETNLTLSDYNEYTSLNNDVLSGGTITASGSGWKTSVFNQNGLATIKRAGDSSTGGGSNGWTKVLIRGWYDRKNNAPTKTASLNAHFRTAEGVNPPTLTVTWNPPAAVIFMKGGTVDIKGGTIDLN